MSAPSPTWTSNRYRMFVAITAAIALLIVLVTQIAGGGSADEALASDEIRLEPVDYTPPDAFTDSVAGDTPEPDPAVTPNPATFPVDPASEGAVASVMADTVGLYGGSLNEQSCDRDRLVDFLESDPAKAQAWVDALNSDPTLSWSGGNRIAVDEIRDYVFELTPIILRTDTWVTNHGFSAGRAVPLQSLLQSGTAVLVDSYGVPRVRCYCGNPLVPPRTVRPVFRGDPWPGFDGDRIVVVNASVTVIQTFVLTDVVRGVPMTRPVGTAGESDVEGASDTPVPTIVETEAPPVADGSALVGNYSFDDYGRDPQCGSRSRGITGFEVVSAEPGGPISIRITGGGESAILEGELSPTLAATAEYHEDGGTLAVDMQFTVDGSQVGGEGQLTIDIPDFFKCVDSFRVAK